MTKKIIMTLLQWIGQAIIFILSVGLWIVSVAFSLAILGLSLWLGAWLFGIIMQFIF